MIDVLQRQQDKVDGMIRAGEERGLKIGEELGLKIGEERGLKIGRERGRVEERARVADILKRHPDADPTTILRLLEEGDR
jgi:hypothetical protein